MIEGTGARHVLHASGYSNFTGHSSLRLLRLYLQLRASYPSSHVCVSAQFMGDGKQAKTSSCTSWRKAPGNFWSH